MSLLNPMTSNRTLLISKDEADEVTVSSPPPITYTIYLLRTRHDQHAGMYRINVVFFSLAFAVRRTRPSWALIENVTNTKNFPAPPCRYFVVATFVFVGEQRTNEIRFLSNTEVRWCCLEGHETTRVNGLDLLEDQNSRRSAQGGYGQRRRKSCAMEMTGERSLSGAQAARWSDNSMTTADCAARCSPKA